VASKASPPTRGKAVSKPGKSATKRAEIVVGAARKQGTNAKSAARYASAASAAGAQASVAGPTRCNWCGTDPLYVAYHDEEWGVPVHADRKLYEFLVLEGAQAGLSWITILRKREAYRQAFAGFDPEKVAHFDSRKVERLLQDPGIVRNRLKVESAVRNAKAFLRVQDEFGSFDAYQWQFIGRDPKRNRWSSNREVPPRTSASDAWSQDMKKRGFSFVGSTILYAHMQAVGMVNDHLTGCFRWKEIGRV